MTFKETIFQGKLCAHINEGCEYYGGYSYLYLKDDMTFESGHGRGQSVHCSNYGTYYLDEKKEELVLTEVFNGQPRILNYKIKGVNSRITKIKIEPFNFIIVEALSTGRTFKNISFDHFKGRIVVPNYLPYIVNEICDKDKYAKDIIESKHKNKNYYIGDFHYDSNLDEMDLDFDYIKQSYSHSNYERAVIPKDVQKKIKTFLEKDVDLEVNKLCCTVYYDKKYNIIGVGVFYSKCDDNYKNSCIKFKSDLKGYIKTDIETFLTKKLKDIIEINNNNLIY